MKYTLEYRGLARVVAKCSPELYLGPVANMLRRVEEEAQRLLQQNSPRDLGGLASNFTPTYAPLSMTLTSTLPYARVMEEGRTPGAKMPPPSALVGWMSRHGLANVPPFVIARAIGQRGIKGRFFLKKTHETLQRMMPEFTRDVVLQITRKWAA